jgi:nucleoside-diphosphate-sugar epimerase
MSILKNVIVVGATGHLGPNIVSAFVGDSRFNLSILTRKSTTATFPEGVQVHHISDDYPTSELEQIFKGQDAVVSCIATASAKLQETLIDVAVKTGVKRFIPSEFGSDVENEKAAALLPQYFAGKRATVQYLKSRENQGLTWSSFVVGPFFEL